MQKRSTAWLSGLIVGIVVLAILGSFLSALSGSATPVIWPAPALEAPAHAEAADAQLINGYQRLQVSTQNVQAVIRTLERPHQYAQTVLLTLYWESAQKSTISAVCVTKDAYSAAVITQGDRVQHNILGKGMLYRWYQDDKDWYHGKAPFMTADLLQRIPTYETILSLAPEQIRLSRYDSLRGQVCIYVEAFDEDSQIQTCYWIDAVQGLLLQAEAFQGEQRIWHAEVSNLSTTDIDESMFRLPNGVDARALSS